MARYLMTICYDGTAYHGWQVQNNAVTVQKTVQDALEQVLGVRPNVTGCSRTDSGVHANEFCFHFDYFGKMKGENIVAAINTKLPKDIAAKSCVQVDDDFHARYSVKSKEYVYKFYDANVRNPFLEGYAHHTKKLDHQKMNLAAKQFIGTYDFCAFCASGSSVQDTVRTVFNANVNRDGDIVTFTVEADGFLYNMVRIMAGTLLYVSMGKIEPCEISEIINSKNRSKAGITAPACGLYLNKVRY